MKAIKDRLLCSLQKHEWIHRLLRVGKAGVERAKSKILYRTYPSFDGRNLRPIYGLLSTYDIVSFDIFDTLISRKVGIPTNLFYVMEDRNGISGFHDKRIVAERTARQKCSEKNGEVDIFDIYRELADSPAADVGNMVREELRAEKETCYANPEIQMLYQLLAGKGSRMIAVSDMYIPGEYLRELLDNCGYSRIEQIFVSCDYGVAKGNGALQRLVQSSMGDKMKCIHIGDNFTSDVLGSKMAGWDAVWYKSMNNLHCSKE